MATLAEVRIDFIKSCMRYDLLASGDIGANVDNGANAFINKAQRWLDLQLDTPKSKRRHMTSFAADAYSVEIQDLLRVDRVTFINADGRKDITDNVMAAQWLRGQAPGLITDWDVGAPTYWAMNVIGLSPEQEDKTSSDFITDGILDYGDIHFATDHAYRGLLFYPKADEVYTLEVVGKFHSATLVDNSDTSFWTLWYDDLLVLASCYILERTLKNSAGMKTWTDAMASQIRGIDVAMVESELSGIPMVLGDPTYG